MPDISKSQNLDFLWINFSLQNSLFRHFGQNTFRANNWSKN